MDFRLLNDHAGSSELTFDVEDVDASIEQFEKHQQRREEEILEKQERQQTSAEVPGSKQASPLDQPVLDDQGDGDTFDPSSALSTRNDNIPAPEEEDEEEDEDEDEDEDDEAQGKRRGRKRSRPTGAKRDMSIRLIADVTRRRATFSKRKGSLLKKACDLSVLTGAEVMVLVASDTGHVYSFASHGLSPFLDDPAYRQSIETHLNQSSATAAMQATSKNDPAARRLAHAKVQWHHAYPSIAAGDTQSTMMTTTTTTTTKSAVPPSSAAQQRGPRVSVVASNRMPPYATPMQANSMSGYYQQQSQHPSQPQQQQPPMPSYHQLPPPSGYPSQPGYPPRSTHGGYQGYHHQPPGPPPGMQQQQQQPPHAVVAPIGYPSYQSMRPAQGYPSYGQQYGYHAAGGQPYYHQHQHPQQHHSPPPPMHHEQFPPPPPAQPQQQQSPQQTSPQPVNSPYAPSASPMPQYSSDPTDI